MAGVSGCKEMCRVCGRQSGEAFGSAYMMGANISYYDCEACGYVQTEVPTWLDKAYASSINLSDTGIMARNLSNVGLVLASLSLMKERKGKVVDYAGGYGFLVRLLRDRGIDAFWADPYSENLVARGFEYSQGRASLVTAFEAFEHFVNPIEEMERLLAISPNILLTTMLMPRPVPQPSEWWYYGLDHGQHIGFYNIKTLEYMASSFGLHLLSDGRSTHFFTEKKMSGSLWSQFKLIARIFPAIFCTGLKSKAWSDHVLIKGG